MRLIDLDQTIFVPVVDEGKGGVKYEMQMTVGEMFDKFCEGFQPKIVDAVPVEWTQAQRIEHPQTAVEFAHNVAYRTVLYGWRAEQELDT